MIENIDTEARRYEPWMLRGNPEIDIINGRLRAAEARLLQHQRDLDFLRAAVVVLTGLLVILGVVLVRWL